MSRTVPALFLVCLMAKVCLATINSPYPGLDYLIERSDAIAVVRVLKQRKRGRLYHEYGVQFCWMLKGTLPEKHIVTVSIANLPDYVSKV